MNYDNNYIKNMAYNVLLKQGVKSIPISLFDICDKNNILLISYQKGNSLIHKLKLESQLKNKGFSLYINQRYIILFDEKQSFQNIRFVIAHELGHIFLEHFEYIRNIEEYENNIMNDFKMRIENDADTFAINLLAPNLILQNLNIKDKRYIAKLCNIPLNLVERSLKNLSNYKIHIKSELEEKLYNNFKTFIEKNKTPKC